MDYITTSIPEVKIIKPSVFGDERGFFMETFRVDEFTKNCSSKPFIQDNHSKSSHGILRGLHYQLESTQGKLVRVTSGEVYDVAVDMRKASPTFGQHVGVILSGKNKRQLWVPEGFAHGFYVMSDTAEFVYKCTNYYAPEHEVSLAWDDVDLQINWPLTNDKQPLLSTKDQEALSFKEAPKFT